MQRIIYERWWFLCLATRCPAESWYCLIRALVLYGSCVLASNEIVLEWSSLMLDACRWHGEHLNLYKQFGHDTRSGAVLLIQ